MSDMHGMYKVYFALLQLGYCPINAADLGNFKVAY